MKKIVLLLAAAIVAVAFFASPAFAGSDTWDGSNANEQGAGNLPCANGGFWVLSPGGNLGTAILTVNGVVVGPMQPAGGGNSAYQLESSGSVTTSSTASVTWSGSNTDAFLKLSHCAGSTTGGTTTGGTDTTTGGTDTTTGGTDTTTGGTDTTTGGTDTTTGGTDTTTGGTTGTTGTGGVSGSTTGGTTGGTAATPSSGELPFTGLPIWMPLLAAAAMLGTGIVLVRRRKAEGS